MGEPIGECLTLDEFQDQRADAVTLLESMDGSDVRMTERGEDASFLFETLGVTELRSKTWRKDLQRDVASKPGIAGAVDLAHPAFAQRGNDLVVAESRAGCKSHGVADRAEEYTAMTRSLFRFV